MLNYLISIKSSPRSGNRNFLPFFLNLVTLVPFYSSLDKFLGQKNPITSHLFGKISPKDFGFMAPLSNFRKQISSISLSTVGRICTKILSLFMIFYLLWFYVYKDKQVSASNSMLLYINLTLVLLDITVFDPDGMENRISHTFLARDARASQQ